VLGVEAVTMEHEVNPQPEPSAPELVAQHAGALRSLALSLLRNTHAAEDAVQDTWLRWLQSPPRSADPPSGWLARVLRNRTINEQREAARRLRREHDRATPERFDPAVAREREATLRSVVAAVIALDEPFKRVVWMRYFEDTQPREIAARLGTTREDVYERLRRAHELLRRKLRGEFGSDERCDRRLGLLVGLVGAVDAPLTLGGGISTLLSSHPLSVLVASAAVIVGAVWIASSPDSGESGEPLAVVRAARPAPQTPNATASTPPEAERESVELDDVYLAAAQTPWARPSHEYEVEVRLVDDYGLPVAEHEVLVAPAGRTLNYVGSTDRDGVLRFRFRGFGASMELDFATSGSEFERRTVAHGEQRVALLARQGWLRFMGAGAPVGALPFELGAAHLADGSVRVTAFRFRAQDTEAASKPHALVGEDGRLTFVEPALLNGETLAEPSDPADGARVALLSFLAHGRSQVRGDAIESTRATCRLSGTVRDANGDDVGNAPIHWRRAGTSEWTRASSSETGRLDLDGFESDEYEFAVGGGAFGRASAKLDFRATADARWDAVLDRGRELRVQILDANGRPLVGWSVVAELCDGSAFVGVAASAEDGRITIPNAPRGPIRLRGAPGKDAPSLTWRLCDAVYANGRESTVRAPLDSTQEFATLRVEATAPPGRGVGVDGVRLSVRRASDTSGVLAGRVGLTWNEGDPDSGGRADFELSATQGDLYELELAFPGAPRTDLGPFPLVPGEPIALDLGPFAPRSTLLLEARPRASGLSRMARLLFRAEDVELASGTFDAALANTFRAGAGAYLLVDAARLRPIAAVELPVEGEVVLRADGRMEPRTEHER